MIDKKRGKMIEIGDLVTSNEYQDPVYFFGMVVGFHYDDYTQPFKIEWLHKEAGWTQCDDFWFDDELELVQEEE